MDARVNYVILPLAHYMMLPDQAAKASGDGYLLGTTCMRWRTDWSGIRPRHIRQNNDS